MKLHPQQAPLYGDCIITVLLTEDDEVQSDDAAFYLVFTGSAVQHCSSTRKLDSGTLETLAPGHDCCETVRVSLCATQQGSPVLVVAEDNFQFVQDEAYDAAQFLASCAGNQQALNFTRFLDRSRPPTADVDFLDEKVVLAFRHLKLPAEWNVLGAEQRLSEHVPRETLLHFAVRLGLLRLTWFLLQQPGGPEALGVPNRDGATPTSLALERGHLQLHQLLAEEGAREPDAWSSLSHTVHSGEHLVKHHRGLNVYTLTAEATEGRRPSLQSSVQQLRLHMESHQQHKMASGCPPSSPRTARETCEVAAGAMAEGGEAAAPAPLDLGAIQVVVPACPEEDGCRPGKEPGGVPRDSSVEAAAEDAASSRDGGEQAGPCREEEEGFPSGANLEEDDGTLGLPAGLPRAPAPPPGGDTREEAGVPGPPGAAPGQGSCCGGNAFRQEAQITAGRAAESVAEPPASCRDCGVGMGQAECRSCAGGQEAAAVPQGVGGGGCGCGAPGRVAVETGPAAGTALTDPAGAASGGGRDAAAPCRTEGSVPEPATVLQGGTCLDADRTVGTDAPAGSARRESATRSADCGHLAVEGQRAAACRGAEVGEGHTAGALETVPGHRAPALGASVDGEGDVGGSGGERGAAAAAESGGPDPRWRPAPESSGAGGAVMERAPGMPAGPETFEPLPGGVADPPGPGPREEGGGPGLGPDCAGASAPAPAPSLGPTGSRGPFGRQPAHAQELLLLASALLVREAVQQAQLTVAQESSSRAAPGGQEAASRHPEPVPQTLLPLPCGEGPECVQGNLMGTPSARHSAGSEQQQAAAAAAEQPAEAGRGRPASGEPAAGPPPPADSAGREADGLPSPRLPGKEEALAEGPAPALAEPSPPGSRGEALPGSDGHAPPEPAGEASRLGTGEGGRGVLPGPGQLLSGDGSVPAGEALPREPEPEPCPARPAASPLSGPPGWMEAPLLPVTASLPGEGEGEGEGVDGLPSRVLLQPIAEELLGDGDSGPEGPFLAHRGGSGPCAPAAQPEVSAQPSECRREASGVQTVPSVRPACPAPDPLEKAEAEAAEAATAGTSLDPSPAREAAWAGQAPGPPAAPPAGTPADAPFAVEPRLDAQREMGAASPPDGGTVVSLQPGGLTERMTGPPPAADSREMEPEEERGSARGLAEEDAAAEETINRENWSPGQPSSDPPLLKLKSSCNDTERDRCVEDGLGGDGTCSQDVLARESGSESDLFPLPGDGMDETDFGKLPEEEQSAGDSTSSSSSADDTISLERNSSLGSDISLPQALGLSGPKDRYSLDGSCFGMVTAEGQDGDPAISGELEEELDSITDVPAHSSVLRNSMRPLSPFRRHSWGPGKNASSEAEISQRSSMRVLGDVVRKLPTHRRSLSWCPSGVQCTAMGADLNGRSYSLEGLAGEADGATKLSSSLAATSLNAKDLQQSPLAKDDGGSLVSLTEEELESEQGEGRGLGQQARQRSQPRSLSFYAAPVVPPLTKSMSLMTIAQVGAESSRPLSSSSANSSLTQSISEEESCHFLPPSSSRKDLEGKSGTKVSRTFSYLKNKMSSSKKSKEKEREKDKDSKEKDKDKKTVNGHLFSTTPTVGPINCYHCMKPFNKDAVSCPTCGIMVHKSCKEVVTACAKVRMKKGGLQPHDTSSLPTVVMRNKSSQPKERPRSAILAPDESAATSLFSNRRSQQNPSLSKSISIQNIAGVGSDESILHTLKFLSQSTDSLNKINRVNESTESLTDEGADMNEGQLMGDFEIDSKQLEAQSWSQVVEGKFLRQQKKDVVKRQDVIYELMQTEMHHLRTLKIMSDVYCRGMVQELQCEQQVVEKVFPCLDSLLSLHSQFFQRILERKKESLADRSSKNFVIRRIGDILVSQFSGENAERMKKTYGKFCGHHNEAVNYFKDLHSKDKRFQAFIKKKMSSSVVRRLGIPECILLVTQRITKYPVLLQRILQYTKEADAEHQDLVLSLNLVKEVITAVNSKVSNYEKKLRLHEIYTRTDLKSIMRMKSGQMFAREDLRRRKFVRDGAVSLRHAAGRLKEVQAVLLSDVLIFLQEKDQKYVFASLDQKSTVISLKKLIVREVAHEEKGLFLISMGGKDPEMVEVHASSKEERSSWIQAIQDTISTLDKEEDEGIPSESEEEKRVLDMKARELKEQLQQKDKQIVTLLEEKEKIFRYMTDCGGHEDSLGARTLFRANMDEAPKGESVMRNVIREVELLQGMVSQSLGSALGQQVCSLAAEQEGVGPVSLPRRAETFGGFDSHQMSVCKGGERDEGEDAQDLRRTESDSVLKKGGTANLMFILRRNNEQVLQSITHLHGLLSTLQAVVVQQDTYIEDQKVLLTERALSRGSFRPSSLAEQERQRSLERQRQELANLQRQRAQHQEERRRREREWEARETELAGREARLALREEQAQRGLCSLEREREELRQRKAAYQLDLEHLRAAQKQLEKEQEQLRRDTEQVSPLRAEPGLRLLSVQHAKMTRTASLPVPEVSPSRQPSSSPSKQGPSDAELSPSPKRNSLSRTHKEKGSFHLLGTPASSQTGKPTEGHNRLFGLAKPKEKKEKRKKRKGPSSPPADSHSPEAAPEGEEIFC